MGSIKLEPSVPNSSVFSPEIWRHIVVCISAGPTLASLVQVSRQVQIIAEYKLYQVIQLMPPHFIDTSTMSNPEKKRMAMQTNHTSLFQHISKFRSFLRTINNNPRLAQYVELFWTILIHEECDVELWLLLSNALLKMKCITNLHLESGITRPLDGLLGCTSFQLQSFSWYCMAEEERILSFICSQKRVHALNLPTWNGTGKPVLHNIATNLTWLRGPIGAARSFVPGRRIKSLHILGSFTADELLSLTPHLYYLEDLRIPTLFQVGDLFNMPRYITDICTEFCAL